MSSVFVRVILMALMFTNPDSKTLYIMGLWILNGYLGYRQNINILFSKRNMD